VCSEHWHSQRMTSETGSCNRTIIRLPGLLYIAKRMAFLMRSPRNRFVHLFAIILLAAHAYAQSLAPDHVVSVAVANMYSSATDDADVVSQAILGTNVVTLESRGDWTKIRTPDGYAGWTSAAVLRPLPDSRPYAASGSTVQVDSLFANLYRETDVTAHKPVLTLPFESRLEVVAEGNGDDARWIKIRLPDLSTAWIQNGDVTRDPKLLTIAQSITLGKKFLGIPYLWGGRSSFGYDCSGFTQMLVRQRGINMPRDADLQATWDGVVAINRKDLQAGDLLFFGSSPVDITHTGMFIGNGEFIHDTTHDHPMVQISRLDDEPWTKILVACRRVK
jgi:gamma-D-glutamyl-L-lysine dipeptidyl-peptidase